MARIFISLVSNLEIYKQGVSKSVQLWMLGVSWDKGKPRLHVPNLRKHSQAALANPTTGCEQERLAWDAWSKSIGQLD